MVNGVQIIISYSANIYMNYFYLLSTTENKVFLSTTNKSSLRFNIKIKNADHNNFKRTFGTFQLELHCTVSPHSGLFLSLNTNIYFLTILIAHYIIYLFLFALCEDIEDPDS